MLFESPAQDLEGGARAGYLGYLTTLEYMADNAQRVMDLVERCLLAPV